MCTPDEKQHAARRGQRWSQINISGLFELLSAVEIVETCEEKDERYAKNRDA
jgi:hypothetical protein